MKPNESIGPTSIGTALPSSCHSMRSHESPSRSRAAASHRPLPSYDRDSYQPGGPDSVPSDRPVAGSNCSITGTSAGGESVVDWAVSESNEPIWYPTASACPEGSIARPPAAGGNVVATFIVTASVV